MMAGNGGCQRLAIDNAVQVMTCQGRYGETILKRSAAIRLCLLEKPILFIDKRRLKLIDVLLLRRRVTGFERCGATS